MYTKMIKKSLHYCTKKYLFLLIYLPCISGIFNETTKIKHVNCTLGTL